MTRDAAAPPEASSSRVRRGGAFAVALGLALVVPVADTASGSGRAGSPGPSWTVWRRGGHGDPVAEAEATFAPLRGALPSGSRVGYVVESTLMELVAEEAEAQRFYSTQFALAPAVLRLVHVPACLAMGPRICGLADLDRVLVRDPEGPLAPQLQALGLVPVAGAGGWVLLARGAR